MKDFLLHLKEKVVIGIVRGSDLVKMEEQIGGDGGEGVSKEGRVPWRGRDKGGGGGRREEEEDTQYITTVGPQIPLFNRKNKEAFI